jgi:hypothetical protein
MSGVETGAKGLEQTAVRTRGKSTVAKRLIVRYLDHAEQSKTSLSIPQDRSYRIGNLLALSYVYKRLFADNDGQKRVDIAYLGNSAPHKRHTPGAPRARRSAISLMTK